MHRSEGVSHLGPQILEAPAGASGGLSESEKKGNWDRLSRAIEVLANPRLGTASVDPRDEVRVGFLRTFKQEVGGEMIAGNFRVSGGGTRSVPEGAVEFMGKYVMNVGDAVDLFEKLPDGGDRVRVKTYLGKLTDVIWEATGKNPRVLYEPRFVANTLKGMDRLYTDPEEASISLAAEPEPVVSTRASGAPVKGATGSEVESDDDKMHAAARKAFEEAQMKYYQTQTELMEVVAEMSQEDWMSALMKNDASGQRAPQLWEYIPPNWMEGGTIKEWNRMVRYVDKFHMAVYDKRNDPDVNSRGITEMAGKMMGKMALPEELAGTLYNHKWLKLRTATQRLMHDLMEEQQESVTIDGVRQVFKYYVFKRGSSDRGTYDQNVWRYVGNEGQYKEELARQMYNEKLYKSVDQAKMSIALSCDLMEMGGVFARADWLRKLDWESDPMRVVMTPYTKFEAKLGKEKFGGKWVMWANSVYGSSMASTDQIKTRMAELKLIPRSIAGSFMNKEVSTMDGQKMTMAEAFYKGKEIKWANKTGDLYFGWRKDQILAGATFLSYLLGGKDRDLQFRDINEVDNVASLWSKDLHDSLHTLRGTGASVLPIEVIAATIGASAGLYPFEGPNWPYLQIGIPKSEKDPLDDMMSVVISVSRQLGLSDKETSKIYELYNIDRKYRVDFGLRMSDYEQALNPNTSTKRRDEKFRNLKYRGVRN